MCDSCLWHIRLRGLNPQTGQEVDNEQCAISWLPLLLIENSQQQRHTAASVDTFRESMLAANEQTLSALTHEPH